MCNKRQKLIKRQVNFYFVIEAKITKRLGDFVLDTDIKEQGIICVTGKNGSGKTTFLRLISGFLKPDKGYIRLNNLEITSLPPEKRNIVLVTPETYIPNLRVDSHITWGAKVKGIKIEEKDIIEAKELLNINFNGKVGKLSLGQREKVSLLTAIFSKPKLILVDEAFSNINGKEEFMKNFLELTHKYSIEVIYTTQDIKDTKFANSHLMMDNGKLVKVV